ncbi:ATP-binding protein [Fulvivirga lutea]|uniref:ATP-binding protein n=1 Tax=Fulvivirga lutea TaxID=2810512 RepID=A0A974WPD6_9BACT|nr:ATP-binding protein [Fulvivirga lutea]QSE99198.1 ATP-binding protein [Fulvivirga lutea]
MKLKLLKIRNFRSYSNEVEIRIDDLNVLIGRNDVGKSSIMEALDIFFNGKPDFSDLSIGAGELQIDITCVFSDLPDSLILDDSVSTSLASEFLLNDDGDLEIVKQFKFSRAGTLTAESFIKCLYPDNEALDDLLSKKRNTLKLQLDELGIGHEGVNRTQSKDLRRAIRDHYYPGQEVQTTQKLIKIEGKLDNEDNRKKIWASISKYLPIYSLFFVDKKLDDQDSDIQDPMKEIVKEVLGRPDIAPLLEQLKEQIQSASTVLADATIEKVNELDVTLAETLRSNFPKEPSWNTIFKLSLEDDRGISLNKRGSGIRRLVLLSFFRAQVDRRKTDQAPNVIYALEEPETSQHPDFQMMIVNSMKELAETENAQVIFTTHNSNLAGEIPKSSLRYIFKEDGNTQIESGTNEDGTDNVEIIDRIIETLGALPDPKNKVKVLIFVEGENDVNGLINYSKMLNNHDANILNLDNNESVAFIPVGGSQLKFYVEKKYLDGLTQAQFHLYDSDKPEYVQKVQELNAENNPRKIGFNTTKRELESYLHIDAILECYAEKGIDITLEAIEEDTDLPLEVAKAVHSVNGEGTWEEMHSDPRLLIEKQKSKISRVKQRLNTDAISKMTVPRLQETEGFDEIVMWLNQISDFINN